MNINEAERKYKNINYQKGKKNLRKLYKKLKLCGKFNLSINQILNVNGQCERKSDEVRYL